MRCWLLTLLQLFGAWSETDLFPPRSGGRFADVNPSTDLQRPTNRCPDSTLVEAHQGSVANFPASKRSVPSNRALCTRGYAKSLLVAYHHHTRRPMLSWSCAAKRSRSASAIVEQWSVAGLSRGTPPRPERRSTKHFRDSIQYRACATFKIGDFAVEGPCEPASLSSTVV